MPTILTEPSRVLPGDGHWQVLENIHGARNRQVLHSPGLEDAPVLEFSAPEPGTYDISVQVKTVRAHRLPEGCLAGVYIKTSAQTYWTFLTSEIDEETIDSLYFDRHELGVDTVQLASFRQAAYVDALILSRVEDRAPNDCQSALAQPAEQIVAGICDIPDDAYLSMPDDLEAASCVWRHAQAGFTRLYWRASAVRCEYWTKVGEVRGSNGNTAEADEQPASKRIEDMLESYDILAQAVEESRRCGMSLYGWMRINNEMHSKGTKFSQTRFHAEHPEYLQAYKSGAPTPRLSFTWPAVRRHKIAMALEIAGYGVDGILIDCLRHPPMVQYDQPAVDAFMAEHGEDPRQMPEDGSEEWLRFRASYFTRFLRELRHALRETHGDQVKLAVRCYSWLDVCLRYGLDVPAWLDEGLIDELVVALYCNSKEHYTTKLDYRPFKERAGEQVTVIGQLWRFGSMPAAEVLGKSFHDQGLDGVAFYESNLLIHYPDQRKRIWRFRDPGNSL